MRILVKMPSRGRPAKLLKAIKSVIINAVALENIHISCTLDSDDEVLLQSQELEEIKGMANVSIAWGLSTSKIHAINRDVPESGWDILVIGSDDIFFNLYGFDEIIRLEMRAEFLDGDGYLHFRESDTKEALNVMTVVDKKYYDRFGYVYHPSYLSLWADNEQTVVSKLLGRYKYINYSIMEHKNPAYSHYNEQRDEMFNAQQDLWQIDEDNFKAREQINFGL